ncbi:MAG: MCE family protein [Betaproteobacteria bacterium]|nr:MAG: MCE family protein [Betaproteobacteria bacterium]
MESRVNFAIVGAFVLVLGALLIGGVLWLASDKAYRQASTTYQVYMNESVSGLSLDAPVRYRGVQVGGVRRIALAPNQAEQVLLTLEIARDTPVKEDTLAVLRVQGLTGIAHIELSGGSHGSPWLTPVAGARYPVIRSGTSLMTRLDTAVTTLLANLNRSSEGINALLDAENRSALRRTLGHLEQFSGTLHGRGEHLDAGLKQAARTMEGATQLTTLAHAELPPLLQRLQRSINAFERMSAEGARAGSRTAQVAEGMQTEALPEARQAVAELRELTASLRRFSATLEHNPAALLYGRPAVAPGPGE